MGLWDKLFGEFVDVIEWTDDSKDTMVYRFERYGNEIKYGAKLTVRESQVAILVNEGRIADLYEPGMYELETNNMPIMTTLENWPSGFNSPFKAEVYFFNMRRFTDLKWGTKNPVMLRDKEFGAVRLRAFGSYTVRVKEPITFIKEIVGTSALFTTEDITNQLRNLILSHFSSVLGESDVPVLDLAANYDDLSDFVTAKIAPVFNEYGLALVRLLVENISLPPNVEEVLDKRTSMGILGNLRDYASFQAAEAIKAAAENPGGGGAEGVGMGMGFAVGKKLTDLMSDDQRNPGSGPPPIPMKNNYFLAIDGHQIGPIDANTVKKKIQSNEIFANSLVWNTQLVDWTPVGKVPEFAGLFVNKPPPLPKS